MVATSLILGIIPSLLWLFFFLTEDWDHPEPTKIIFYIFMGGGLAAILASLPELFILKTFPELSFSEVPSILLVVFALIEELSKFVIVYILMKKSRYFDERVDAMIYMITVGLGFAALENVLNLISAEYIAEVTLVRGIGATLLHALASAILGFYWVRKRALVGIVAATLLHALFNYFILKLPGVEIYASSLLFFAAIVVFHDFEILKKKDHSKKRKRLPFRP